MSRFSRRDLAVFVLVLALTVVAVAVALFAPARWAIAALGALIGLSVLVAYAQFAVRRSTYLQLRRESRATREESKRVLRQSAVLVNHVEGLREELVRVRDVIRQDLSGLAVDSSSLRGELRGVRVSQQLFSQTLVATRTELEQAVERLAHVASKGDTAELRRLMKAIGDAVVTRQEWAVTSDAAKADFGELREYVERATRSLKWELRSQEPQLLSDFQSMEQLLRRFSPDAALPPVAGWAMSPAGLLMLTDEIVRRDAELVVECGSGSSTLWMALAMRSKGKGKVIALEHLPEYADRTRAVLDAHGVSEWAEVRVAPLVTVTTPQGDFRWYDTDDMNLDRKIDILLVDGPPTTTGKHARYPALSKLGSALQPAALVVLDDADREDEREVLDLWVEEWPGLVQRSSPGRGIEVFTLGATT